MNYDSVTKPLAQKERIVLATLEDNMHSVVDPMNFREALYPGATDAQYSRMEMQEILKVYIARVRNKLPNGPFTNRRGQNEHYIHTVNRLGYMLYDPNGDGYTDNLHRGLLSVSSGSSLMS